MTAPPLIRIEGAVKSFGTIRAVDDVSLEVERGEFLALLGPSGCGKTTLLRAVAGLENLDRGGIEIDGVDMSAVPPYRRPVNMVFQSYALFPHLSVAGNVAFGLKQDGMPAAETERRVGEVLALLRLEKFAAQKPDRLSGGQKQRVALARALVKRPKALLLDEPMAALDRKLRESTRAELVRLQRQLGTTFIMVTHDQDEALATASRIAVMKDGKILQIGAPREVYEGPASRWIAEFIGAVNILDVDVDAELVGHCPKLGLIFRQLPGDATKATSRAIFGLRPERIEVGGPGGANSVEGEIVELSYLGDRLLMRVKADGGGYLKASVSGALAGRGAQGLGDKVRLSWTDDAMFVLST